MIRAPSPLIISHPERQSGTQHTLFGALTVGIWALWIYLWLPLITGILWIVGIRWAYIQVFKGTRGISLWVVVWILGAVIVTVAYWSSYNIIRYAGNTQRRRAKAVSKAVIGRKFGVTSDALYTLVHERRLNLYFDKRGELTRVDAIESATAEAFPATKPVRDTISPSPR
jgi:poly-beta-1,6-N-acetyl-D-glucosamine biosynthesis protein PgaD